MGVREVHASKLKYEFTKKKLTARQRYDRAISGLLGKLCIEWGFSGDAKEPPFDHRRSAWTAEEFALEVLRAEGMKPLIVEGIGPSQSEWFKKIHARFSAEFGGSIGVGDFEQT